MSMLAVRPRSLLWQIVTPIFLVLIVAGALSLIGVSALLTQRADGLVRRTALEASRTFEMYAEAMQENLRIQAQSISQLPGLRAVLTAEGLDSATIDDAVGGMMMSFLQEGRDGHNARFYRISHSLGVVSRGPNTIEEAGVLDAMPEQVPTDGTLLLADGRVFVASAATLQPRPGYELQIVLGEEVDVSRFSGDAKGEGAADWLFVQGDGARAGSEAIANVDRDVLDEALRGARRCGDVQGLLDRVNGTDLVLCRTRLAPAAQGAVAEAGWYAIVDVGAERRLFWLVVLLVGSALVGGLLLVGFGLWWLLPRWVTGPVRTLAEALERLARGELDQPVLDIRVANEVGDMMASFNAMLLALQRLHENTKRVAEGDLDVTIEGGGQLADAFAGMLYSLRELVQQIASGAGQLSTASTEIQATARLQEQGATEQASAVAETLRTMESLIEAGKQIAKSSQDALSNAQGTHGNNEVIAQRMRHLAGQTERISEILERIKEIANKADLLALNAALEGTKAGAAGRGFSLVATQMQRLAENVMGAVQDIRSITDNIQDATSASVLATEDGVKLAGEARRSAESISLIIGQQQSGIEQVSTAMHDVSEIARSTATGSKEVAGATTELIALSRGLQSVIAVFRTRGESGRDRGRFSTDASDPYAGEPEDKKLRGRKDKQPA